MSMLTSSPVARELDDFWRANASLWQQWQYEADLDTKMTVGQQDYWNSFYNQNYRNTKQLQFNKIQRLINMIGGYQRKNRLATIVQSADNEDDNGETADQLTKCLSWVHRQDKIYEKYSECFDGANTCGLNLLSFWMDFREDVESGEIRATRLPFSSFLMDPYWTKKDLSDCDRIWTRRYLSPSQVISLFPDIKKDLKSMGKTGSSFKDGKFQFMPQNWYQYQQDLYAYDEYWKLDYKYQRRVVDKVSGEYIDWKGTREQFQLFKRFNPNIELIKAYVPTIKLHILINNNEVYEETSPWGINRYPFVPYTAYHNIEVQNYAWRYTGVTRNCRDSQIELNKRRNRLLDILDAQTQSGLMVKEDSLVNPEDAFLSGPGKVLYFKQNSNLQTDVAPIPPPPVAQGWMELIQSLDNEIMSIAGAVEELFGDSGGDRTMSGFMTQLRMGAGLVSLQNIFDSLNESQREAGEICMQLIQNNFTVEKLARIIGQQPSEEIKSLQYAKYHLAVEEGTLTATQRQLQFVQALQMKQLEIPISNAYLIKSSTLQGKKQIIEDLEAQEQAQQQQQQQMAQLEMQKLAMETRSLESISQANFASAEERKARAISDIGLASTHITQGQADMAKAELDGAKAIKELEGIDHERLISTADFIFSMHERQQAMQHADLEQARAEKELNSMEVTQAEQATKTQ